jgi:hypothetical protein
MVALAACSRDRAPTAGPDVVTAQAFPSSTVVSGDAAARTEDASAPRPMIAEDWEIARGTWSFQDGEASCACTTGSSLLYWKRDRPADFDASIDVRFSTTESSVGLVFREVGDDFVANASFYQLEWYTRGTHHDRRLSLMIKNPYWVQIVTPLVREPPIGQWIRLRVRARGDRIETWVDGEPVFEKVDTTFARAGRIGVHSFATRPIRLRDFRLTVLDAGTR